MCIIHSKPNSESGFKFFSGSSKCYLHIRLCNSFTCTVSSHVHLFSFYFGTHVQLPALPMFFSQNKPSQWCSLSQFSFTLALNPLSAFLIWFFWIQTKSSSSLLVSYCAVWYVYFHLWKMSIPFLFAVNLLRLCIFD